MPWDIPSKSFIRNNGRNSGPTVWDEDALASQVIDSDGHDTHDQDIAGGITACLNINGVNEMLQDLPMGGLKITGLGNGTDSADAINVSQGATISGEAAAASAEAAAAQATADQAQIDADAAQATASANTDSIDILTNVDIASASWNGNILTLNRVNAAPATVEIDWYGTFKSNGPIRHLFVPHGTGTATIDTAVATRNSVTNDGALTLTITKPTAIDPDLGENYQVEGQVLFTNGATPGTVTIAGAAAADVLGVNSEDASAKYLLSYIIQRSAGDAYNELYIWSAI